MPADGGAPLVVGDAAPPDEQAATTRRSSRSNGKIEARALRAVETGNLDTMRLHEKNGIGDAGRPVRQGDGAVSRSVASCISLSREG
jgi:hypothetical protein